MLTTIGDKIVEIRPKQVIESSVEVDNHYLVPIVEFVSKKNKKTKKVENDRLPEHKPTNTQASS